VNERRQTRLNAADPDYLGAARQKSVWLRVSPSKAIEPMRESQEPDTGQVLGEGIPVWFGIGFVFCDGFWLRGVSLNPIDCLWL